MSVEEIQAFSQHILLPILGLILALCWMFWMYKIGRD